MASNGNIGVPQMAAADLPAAVIQCIKSSPALQQAFKQFVVMNGAQENMVMNNPQMCQMFLEMMGTSFFQLQQMTMMQQQQMMQMQQKLKGDQKQEEDPQEVDIAPNAQVENQNFARIQKLSGVRVDPKAARRTQELVKAGLDHSGSWKKMWVDWCHNFGGGVQDPMKHTSVYIIAFILNKFGLSQVVGASWAASYLVALGECAKPYMVATIKKGEKTDEGWKSVWDSFADSKMIDSREPMKHEAGSLMEFFDTIAMAQFKEEEWMIPYCNGQEDGNRPPPPPELPEDDEE